MNKFTKKLLSSVIIAIFALGGVAASINLIGCTTAAQSNAVTVEYQTLSGVINLVSTARGAYNTLFNAGKISADLDARVSSAYFEYQRIGNLALSTARAQAVAVAAGTDPKTLANNPYIADLQNLVNGLLAIFTTTTPPSTTVTSVKIVKNATVGELGGSRNLNEQLHSTK